MRLGRRRVRDRRCCIVRELVRADHRDLSARQLAVFLTAYLSGQAHTVRGLAADLNVSKPAISRALDRLGELNLVRRKTDPADRRSVVTVKTADGMRYLDVIRRAMAAAAAQSQSQPEPAPEEQVRRAARS
ncbi:MarR family winged helix-turn-helix transcriptional regulator [Falsiroseomonas sp. HW251]|uniref:MarR family winged helix-turn-helix transcriptional regulator n=1 Tax=Falsiroseomonas sp. HW251 TaxID=3390998 RepID=UPI003D310C00